MDYSDILQDISVDLSSMVKKHLKNIKKLDSKQQKQFGNLFGDMKQGIDDLSEGTYESVNEAKIAFINDKLIGDRIQKSGLLPLLGDNNVSLNPNKVKFTRELRDTLVKLYKKYSSKKYLKHFEIFTECFFYETTSLKIHLKNLP